MINDVKTTATEASAQAPPSVTPAVARAPHEPLARGLDVFALLAMGLGLTWSINVASVPATLAAKTPIGGFWHSLLPFVFVPIAAIVAAAVTKAGRRSDGLLPLPARWGAIVLAAGLMIQAPLRAADLRDVRQALDTAQRAERERLEAQEKAVKEAKAQTAELLERIEHQAGFNESDRERAKAFLADKLAALDAALQAQAEAAKKREEALSKKLEEALAHGEALEKSLEELAEAPPVQEPVIEPITTPGEVAPVPPEGIPVDPPGGRGGGGGGSGSNLGAMVGAGAAIAAMAGVISPPLAAIITVVGMLMGGSVEEKDLPAVIHAVETFCDGEKIDVAALDKALITLDGTGFANARGAFDMFARTLDEIERRLGDKFTTDQRQALEKARGQLRERIAMLEDPTLNAIARHVGAAGAATIRDKAKDVVNKGAKVTDDELQQLLRDVRAHVQLPNRTLSLAISLYLSKQAPAIPKARLDALVTGRTG